MSAISEQKSSGWVKKGSLNTKFKNLFASFGISTLDYYLGGGIAVGSLLLVEYSGSQIIADALELSFVKQSEAQHDDIFKANLEAVTDYFSEASNDIDGNNRKVFENNVKEDGELCIAWRYRNKLMQNECNSDKEKETEEMHATSSSVRLLPTFSMQSCIESTRTHHYAKLLNAIKCEIENMKKVKPMLLRISLKALHTPLWFESNCNESWFQLTRFLLSLRRILRSTTSCCLLTIPSRFVRKNNLHALHRCCDVVLQFKSIVSSNKDLHQYDGHVFIKKNCMPNTISTIDVDTDDLVFKIKKMNLSIEKIYLNPDISTKTNSNQIQQNSSICGSFAW